MDDPNPTLPTQTPAPLTDVRTYDDLATGLQELRIDAGVSYRELHRRVLRERRRRRIPELPAYDTVYRCLQPGRVRLDPDLVADIARALGASDVAWRRACRALARPGDAAVGAAIADLPAGQPLVGRETALATLASTLASEAGAVSVVTGMAGVGKTALVVEAARRFVRSAAEPRRRGERQPEPVCFVDLQGFDPVRSPVPPEAVLEPLLRRLGLPPEQIARADLSRRIGLLREALRGQRALVVLDNVRDEEQVRPLLPEPTAPSRLLITSRHHLQLDDAGLTLALDVLSPAESVTLLSKPAAVAAVEGDQPAEPTRLAELAELSGHLPLALSITAGRIAARHDWTLADHADRLRAMQAAHRLDAGVEASLRLSYADLGADDRRLLRLLSQLPVSAFDEHLAAAIADLPVPDAGNRLDQLARAFLVRRTGDGRYGLHDVVRLFLAGRSLEEDPPRVRERALDRLYDYQVAATAAARARYAPQLQPPADLPSIGVPAFSSRAAATAWLERERADLLSGASSALDRGRLQPAVALSVLLFSFLVLNTYVDDADRLYSRLAAATSGADRAGALLSLGAVNGAAGLLDRVRAPLEEALGLYEQLGHTEGVGKALHNLGALCVGLGDYRAAADYYHRALQLASEVEGPSGVALTVDNVGMLYARLGRHMEAKQCHQLALEIHRRLDDRLKEGRTLGSLGALATRERDVVGARELLDQALATSRVVGDWIGESLAVSRLAELDSLEGRHSAAVDGQRNAVALARSRPGPTEEALEVMAGLAAAYRRGGRLAEAAAALDSATAAARAAGDPYWTARALAEGAELAAAAGDHPRANLLRAEAAELFERLGCPEADLVARRSQGHSSPPAPSERSPLPSSESGRKPQV